MTTEPMIPATPKNALFAIEPDIADVSCAETLTS